MSITTRKAIVLSSGGVDSTTALGLSINELGKENVVSVSIFYGQKHVKELDKAKSIAHHYCIPHYELNLSQIFSHSNCPLLAHSTEDIRHASYVDQIEKDGEGMVRTYVPFRNGLMLSAVASLAGSLFPDSSVVIVLGAHADDAAGNAYADCSSAFTEAMREAIYIGTYGKVCVHAPFVELAKKDIVAIGLKNDVPYQLTWSCYEGGEEPCGTCGTCIDRAAAFAANDAKDPAIKED